MTAAGYSTSCGSVPTGTQRVGLCQNSVMIVQFLLSNFTKSIAIYKILCYNCFRRQYRYFFE